MVITDVFQIIYFITQKFINKLIISSLIEKQSKIDNSALSSNTIKLLLLKCSEK